MQAQIKCLRTGSRARPVAKLCRPRLVRASVAAVTPATTQQEVSTSKPADFEGFVDYILQLQQDIIKVTEALEKGERRFVVDRWERDAEEPSAGYGITCVLEGGAVVEKAAANISVIRGKLTAQRAQAMSSRGRANIDPKGGQEYSAAALSLVFHSAHPHIPTLRADVRLFQVAGQAWYGGGCDLTPNYLDETDVKEFHKFWKNICDKYGPTLYPEYKAWCDRYFHIPARGEHRGVGGLFFDDIGADEVPFDAEAFVKEVGKGIIPSWLPIVARQRPNPFTPEQRDWQLLRRGRYLEFNLLYDRGVKFGLDGGRFESIMVSAPPLIAWKYMAVPKPGSPEDDMLQVLKSPREWA